MSDKKPIDSIAHGHHLWLNINQDDDALWAEVFLEPAEYPTRHVIDFCAYESAIKERDKARAEASELRSMHETHRMAELSSKYERERIEAKAQQLVKAIKYALHNWDLVDPDKPTAYGTLVHALCDFERGMTRKDKI